MHWNIVRNRFGGVILLFIFFLVVSFITRISIAVYSYKILDNNFGELLIAFFYGGLRDILTAFYVSFPLSLWLTACSEKTFHSRANRFFMLTIASFIVFALIATSFGEAFFWTEFGTRYNFIAKDYVIYIREIAGSISQAFPMPIVMPIAAMIGIFFAWRLSKTTAWRTWMSSVSTLKQRLLFGIPLIIIPVIAYCTIRPRDHDISQNSYNNELALNGINTFFSALTHEPIDYDHYFPTLPEKQVFQEIYKELEGHNIQFVPCEENSVLRKINHEGQELRLNVIQITVESLSSHLVSSLKGKDKQLTPNLDAIIAQSVVFTNLKATGTRTARGIESLTLGLPPTPGGSIIRNEDTNGLFNIGTEFQRRNYETKFIYAGFSDFDNMSAFFWGNGFSIIDRNDYSPEEQSFENVWGLCDEDLFKKVIREADVAHDNARYFFHFVLTTSNHRPFTFPEGKVNYTIGSQEPAAAYTDYCLGKFFETARTKPWFENTIFVIVGDHGIRVQKESTDFPVEDYEIPLIVYAPKYFAPKKIDTLCSQMDYPPTLLALLNWSYESRFLGKDILSMKSEDGRALFGTYEKLAFQKEDKLVVLNALRPTQFFTYSNESLKHSDSDKKLLNLAISYYQSAGQLYKNRECWEDPDGKREEDRKAREREELFNFLDQQEP